MKKYAAIFNTSLQNAITWRGQLWFYSILNIFPFIAYYFLWTAVFANRSMTAGFSYHELMTYSVVALLFSRITNVAPEYGMMKNIREGSLTKYLIQPVSYLGYYLASRTAQRLFIILVWVPVVVGVIIVLRNILLVPAHGWQWILFLLSLPLAYALQFLFGSFLGLLTFWILEARYFQFVKGLLLRLLSGVLLPVAFFPGTVQRVLEYLPFKFLASFPVNIYLGKVSIGNALVGVMTGLVWIGILQFLLYAMWRKGIRRYVAVGN